MFTNRLRKIAASLFLIAAFGMLYTGCGKNGGPTAPDNNDNPTPTPGAAVIKGPIVLTPGNELVPTFGETNLIGYLRSEYSGSTQYLGAEFLAGNQAILGGNVSVNGNTLDVSGVEYYSSKNGAGFPNVKFDGSAHNWTVSGSANVPAFTASVKSPTVRPTMIAPALNASAPKNQPLKVEWSAPGYNEVQILLYQLSPGYQVTAAVAVMAQGASYTFTPEQLAIFQSGQITVQISSMHHTIAQAGNGKYMVVSSAYKARHLTLQ